MTQDTTSSMSPCARCGKQQLEVPMMLETDRWQGASSQSTLSSVSLMLLVRAPCNHLPLSACTVPLRHAKTLLASHHTPKSTSYCTYHPRLMPHHTAPPVPSQSPALKGRLAYRRAIVQRLIPALRAFSPGLILISAGFDGADGETKALLYSALLCRTSSTVINTLQSRSHQA